MSRELGVLSFPAFCLHVDGFARCHSATAVICCDFHDTRPLGEGRSWIGYIYYCVILWGLRFVELPLEDVVCSWRFRPLRCGGRRALLLGAIIIGRAFFAGRAARYLKPELIELCNNSSQICLRAIVYLVLPSKLSVNPTKHAGVIDGHGGRLFPTRSGFLAGDGLVPIGDKASKYPDILFLEHRQDVMTI